MKRRFGIPAWATVVCFVGFAFASSGQSLGELAKKEKKRREENKTEVEVMDDTALRSSGGSSEATESSGKPVDPDEEKDLASKIFPPVGNAGASETGSTPKPGSAADQKREAGRIQLESVFRSMVGPANSLIATARLWVASCEKDSTPASNCDDLLRRMASLAIDVGNKLDAAHEVARVSLLPAGEVRELRRRFGMHDTVWDQAVHFAHKFRR